MRRHPYEPPNQKMVYSFSNGQVQTPHPVYAPLVEPISRPEQSLQLSFHSQPHFQTQPPSNSNSELRITKDIKNVKEDYQKLFMGGDLSDESRYRKPISVDQRNVPQEGRMAEEMFHLKAQYQKKINMLEEQNEQSERNIRQQYEEYIDKLRGENNQLIGINQEYESEVKGLLKEMDSQKRNRQDDKGDNLRLEITARKEENLALKKQLAKYEEEKKNILKSGVVKKDQEDKIAHDERRSLQEKVDYLQQQLMKSTILLQQKQRQISSLIRIPKDNDLLFQIDRSNEIINQKNSQISNIKLFNSTMEKKLASLEHVLGELTSYKDKFIEMVREKKEMQQADAQAKKNISEKAKQIELLNVDKIHQQKKEEYLASKVAAMETRNRSLDNDLKELKTQLDAERKKKREQAPIKDCEQYLNEVNEAVREVKFQMGQSQRLKDNDKQAYEKQNQLIQQKFTELITVLEAKEKELSDISSSLNQVTGENTRLVLKIKEHEESVSQLRHEIDNKNMQLENRRGDYEKGLVKCRNEAEITYNKNLDQFREKISRLEAELAQGPNRMPQRLGSRTNIHIRNPYRSKMSSRRESMKSRESMDDARTMEFEQRINEYLSHNTSEDVYHLMEEAKMELRLMVSESSSMQERIRVLETSKDLDNKSMIADDKIKFGEARIGYITQKNTELEERITLLIQVNTDLKQKVEESNLKQSEFQRKLIEVQDKLDRTEDSNSSLLEKHKEDYDKLFEEYTNVGNKVPSLQKIVNEQAQELAERNRFVKQIAAKNDKQSKNDETKSSYYHNRINNLNKELEYAQQDSAQLKNKCWKMEMNQHEFNREVETLSSELRGKDTELKLLTSKHSEASVDLNVKTEELAALKLELVTLKNTNQLLNDRLKHFASQEQVEYGNSTKEILNLHNLLQQSSVTLNSFKQHREASDLAVKDAKKQISGLISEIALLKGEVEIKDRLLNDTKEMIRRESSNHSEGPRHASPIIDNGSLKADNEILALNKKCLALELTINQMKQNYSETEGRLMISTQQLQAERSHKEQLQCDLSRRSDEVVERSKNEHTPLREKGSLNREQSDSNKQILQLEKRLKIVSEEKESLMKELKEHVTQTHNETSQSHDRFNAFLKQQLEATQHEIEQYIQTTSSLQILNDHYYTLLQQIPTRYGYYITFMKNINSEFRELVGELDLTSSLQNNEVSNKLLNNITESLQIFDQLKQLEDQVYGRIKELENLKF